MQSSSKKVQLEELLNNLSRRPQSSQDTQQRVVWYRELFELIDMNDEYTTRMVAANTWKIIQVLQTDIVNLEIMNPCLQKAYTNLGRLSERIGSMFTDQDIKTFFLIVFSKIATDKKHCALCTWLLGRQRFEPFQLAPYMRQIFESLNTALKNPFHSESAWSESVKSLTAILSRVPEEDALKFAEYWLVELFTIVVSTNVQQKVKDRARDILYNNPLMQKLAQISVEGDALRQKISSSLRTKLAVIVDTATDMNVEAWQLLCLTADVSDKNRVTAMAQHWKPFFDLHPIKAIQAWRYFVCGLSSTMTKQKIVFLLKPLNFIFSNRVDNPESILAAFDVWCVLVSTISRLKNVQLDLQIAFEKIVESYEQVQHVIKDKFIALLEQLPPQLVGTIWRTLMRINDPTIQYLTILLVSKLGFHSVFDDLLKECVANLRASCNNMLLWSSISEILVELLSALKLQINEDRRIAAPTQPKLFVSPLVYTVREFLLYPIQTRTVDEESLSIWNRLLSGSHFILKYYNTPPTHYPDKDTQNSLKIAHVGVLLSELIPLLEDLIARCESEEKEIPSDHVIPYFNIIIEELKRHEEYLCTSSYAENIFTQMFHFWLLLLERNIAVDRIASWNSSILKWKGFKSYLTKCISLNCADKFADHWPSILTTEFSVELCREGLMSPSVSVQQFTSQWFSSHSPKWNITNSDMSSIRHLLEKFGICKKVTIVEPDRMEDDDEAPSRRMSARFKSLDNANSPMADSPNTPHDEGSLLDFSESPALNPDVNSISILRSVTKRKRSEMNLKCSDSPPPRESTVKKRKVSKSKFVVVEEPWKSEADEDRVVDVAARKEKRALYSSFNPTLQSLPDEMTDHTTPHVDRSPVLLDKTPSTVHNPVSEKRDEDIEMLLGQINTGCTPNKVQEESPAFGLTIPRVLFPDAQSPQETEKSHSTDTPNPQAIPEETTDTANNLEASITQMQLQEIIKSLQIAAKRIKIVENSKAPGLELSLLRIQKEAMAICTFCTDHVEKIMQDKYV